MRGLAVESFPFRLHPMHEAIVVFIRYNLHRIKEGIRL
jgi:hypothetical protein